MSYQDALQDLFRRNRRGIKPGLEATRDLARAMNVDLNKLPMVLVAGTNGKGSVSSLISHFCTQFGLKTGHYSSPHLLRYTERIRVDGCEISQDDVVALWESVKAIESSLDHPPSFFEICTVMAHQYFQAQRCDIVVFEVGLGGRLDATNAADPALSVITNIGLDHQHILGETLQEISFEKAGIARSGVPCVLGHQSHSEVPEVLETEVRKRGGVPVWAEAPRGQSGRVTFVDHNIETALTAFREIQRSRGVEPRAPSAPSTQGWNWPGRLEHHQFSNRPDVLLDGAHNAQAIEALCNAIKLNDDLQGERIFVLYSCVNTRDPAELIPHLDTISKDIFLAPSSIDKSVSQQDFASLARGHHVYSSIESGLDSLHQRASDRDLIVVTGSLFAVADAKAWLTEEPRDPPIQG